MKTLQFSIQINESREKVWHTMLDDATYRVWTLQFNAAGSWYEGEWKTGSSMRFCGPDPATGKIGGMVSRIAESRAYEFVSIEHLGMLVDGVEDTTSEEVKKWAPSFEKYTFKELGKGTEVVVDIDVPDEYVDMFNDMWPRALEALRELAEK